jgi:hypothetical protein
MSCATQRLKTRVFPWRFAWWMGSPSSLVLQARPRRTLELSHGPDERPVLIRGQKLTINNNTGKPNSAHSMVGPRPYLSFDNSSRIAC